jgi:hypothetical protein
MGVAVRRTAADIWLSETRKFPKQLQTTWHINYCQPRPVVSSDEDL